MARAERLTAELLRDWPLPLDESSGKHGRGTVLVAGGTRETPGAVLLAGLAALRVGAGRLQLATDASAVTALAVAVPEASVTALEDADPEGCEAVVLGVGLAEPLQLAASDAATVLDAGCLRGLEPPAGAAVLTPNPVELEHLGRSAEDVAQRYDAVVLTQDLVAAPDGRVWTSDLGDIGLGTSGSGDVLAGIVGGLLARGAEPAQAACWAQWLHCAAGQRLSRDVGRVGWLARELLDALPRELAALS